MRIGLETRAEIGGRSRFLRPEILATLLIAMLLAGRVSAAVITYAPPAVYNGPDVSYPSVSEASNTDPVPLYGEPSLLGNNLVFRNLNFNSNATSLTPSSDFTDGERPTPFYLQQHLGGSDSIRALRSYRFQDQALFVVSAEYRWRAHRYLDIVPFIDAGTAAPSLSRLSFNSVNIAPGIAVRARTDRRTIARVELAKGPEGYRLLVGTGPSF